MTDASPGGPGCDGEPAARTDGGRSDVETDPDQSGAEPGPDGPDVDAGSSPPDVETDVETAVAAVRDRATEVREREVETALTKLDSRGDLSAADREAVERLADRLVGRLTAVPERGLRAAAAEEDAERVEAVFELFG